MHHALQIPEIVASIFDHCSVTLLCQYLNPYPRNQATTDLAALARTCRAFKEPALDVLWRDLNDLTPLVRCVPMASRRSRSRQAVRYSFIRSLTPAEWDVFRSYARRIQSVQFFDSESRYQLHWESVTTFLNPPATDPPFPNLRTLRCGNAEPTMSLLRWHFPSLVHLQIAFRDGSMAQVFLESFSKHSPNITELHLTFKDPADSQRLSINPGHMCSWKNLRSVILVHISLDVEALVHLSRLPTLTTLKIVLRVIFPASNQSLAFPKLDVLKVYSPESLDPISQLISNTQPAVLRTFRGKIRHRTSRQELLSFFASFRARASCPTIEVLGLEDASPFEIIGPEAEAFVLDFDTLQSCMAFRHLRYLNVDIQCDVTLTSSQVLMLASVLPKLEDLAINVSWGWNTAGGLIPRDLVRLLKACQSLERLAVRFDTRGYAEVPTLEDLECKLYVVCVLDSALEAQSVAAITTFFCRLAARTSCEDGLGVYIRGDAPRRMLPDMDDHESRWREVGDAVERVSKF